MNSCDMTEIENYWSLWSPYWSYLEDTGLDVDAVNELANSFKSPVLVIGAGQGMLVEELQKKGFQVDGVDYSPQMVAYAKDRRGLDLIQASAGDMPFPDKTYETSVIATGVIDFLEDEKQIESIINETFRVTVVSGRVFAGFFRYHPKVERLIQCSGGFTENGLHRLKRLIEMTKLSCDDPIGYLRAFKSEATVGLLIAAFHLINVLLFLPKKEKRARRRLEKMWEEANNELDNPEVLIDSVPEFVPYRSEETIRDLFKRLNISTREVWSYDGCIVVQV